MTLSERHRREIFDGFEQSHGETFANNIMELLPRSPTDELVTRTDMHAFGSGLAGELRGEMAELRGELRSEMVELRTELTSEMVELRTELTSEMVDLRTELTSEMERRFATAKVETQRLIGASMAANAIAVATALLM